MHCWLKKVILFSVILWLANDCGPLAIPKNGSSFGNETTYPNKMIFSCDKGFILIGSVIRQCQANRTWSGLDTSCKGERKRESLWGYTLQKYIPSTFSPINNIKLLTFVVLFLKRLTVGSWVCHWMGHHLVIWQCFQTQSASHVTLDFFWEGRPRELVKPMEIGVDTIPRVQVGTKFHIQ